MQGRSLEAQLEAAAGGRPEGLLGVVAEVVVAQAATGRCKREGARSSRHPPVGQIGRDRGPRGVRGRGPQRRALWVCRLCVGCARAGLTQGTRRERLVAINVRAGAGCS